MHIGQLFAGWFAGEYFMVLFMLLMKVFLSNENILNDQKKNLHLLKSGKCEISSLIKSPIRHLNLFSLAHFTELSM